MSHRLAVRQITKNPENWIVAIVGAFGAVFFVQTFTYRHAAALFPRWVSVVVASLCFFRLGRNIHSSLAGRVLEAEQEEGPRRGLIWYWTLLGMVIYAGLIYLSGFVWGTGIFLLFFPAAAGYKRWVIVLIIAVATPILIEVAFSLFLQILLPKGILFTLF